ncbi:MAG: GNVR domain-containing protein [Gemmatimonadaceae bacterium]
MTRDVVDVGRLIDAARRHWRGVAAGAAIGALIALAYARTATPRYEATSTVRIDVRPSTLPSIYADQAARDEIFTEIEVLRSRTIAADVVDSLALSVEMTQPRRTPRADVFASLRQVAPADVEELRLVRGKDGKYTIDGTKQLVTPGVPVTVHGVRFVLAETDVHPGIITLHLQPREATLEQLLKDIDIGRAGLQANIIALRYASEDPALARDVLNVWTSSFIRRRQSIQRAEATSTATFIQAQLDTLSPQLAKAEDRLLAFRNANKIVAPEVEAMTQVNQRALLQATRNDLESERTALAQAMSRVRLQAASTSLNENDASPYRDLIGFPTLLRNQAASELLRSLSSLDDQRSALLMRRTIEDPDVVTLSERIRVVEGQLQALTSTYLRGLTAQVTAADASLAGYTSRMREIPKQEVEYARLQRAPRVYEEMVGLLQTRLKEAQITEAVQDPSVRVVDMAVLPSKPSWPKTPLLLMAGLLTGMLAGAATGFTRETRVSMVRSRRDLQEVSDVPVLGLIPSFSPAARLIGNGARQGAVPGGPRPALQLANGRPRTTKVADLAAAEAFVRLYMNAEWSAGRPLRSILATSPLPGDGKTTSVLHLAGAAAGQQRRVLVVDADLRCGGLTHALELREQRGLVDMLTGDATLAECIVSVPLPGGGRADAIGAGSITHVASVPQIVDAVRELLRQATHYDVVLIDTPPINIVADAAALAPLTDGVLLVTRAGQTSLAAIDVALDQLERAGAHVLGTVLNRAELQRSEGYGTLQQYHAYTLSRS